MRKLGVFNFISLNGFYKGMNEDISWHVHDAEGNKFSEKSVQGGCILLFGRVTYELMANFWPTPMAVQNFPVVAKGMNEAEKIVFSNTLKKVDWNNTTIMKGNIAEEIRKMKQTPGKNMTILGSGSILTLFAEHGLIDEFQFMLDPVVIGKGTPVFHNINQMLNLKLVSTRTFKSGIILLVYEPKK